jgi:hypothetical protein
MILAGTPTVLSPPSVFAQVATNIDGRSMNTPVFIINGSTTTSIGQKVTLNGTPTVLAVPDLVPTAMAVAMDGIAGLQYAYVVSGSSVATIGQTVVVGGETMVLAAPTGPAVWKVVQLEDGTHRGMWLAFV